MCMHTGTGGAPGHPLPQGPAVEAGTGDRHAYLPAFIAVLTLLAW